ncbi:hypothetical protein [Rickettsia hoogstraalii]|nr:hypothetical protein [Rickettsia hoogstraalii]
MNELNTRIVVANSCKLCCADTESSLRGAKRRGNPEKQIKKIL